MAHEEEICLLFTKLIHFLLYLTNIFWYAFYWYQHHSQLDSTQSLEIISVLIFLCMFITGSYFKGNRFSCLLLSVQSTWFVPGEMWNWMWLSPGWSCTQQLVLWSLKLIRRTWYEDTHCSTYWQQFWAYFNTMILFFFQYRKSQFGDKVATTPSVSL